MWIKIFETTEVEDISYHDFSDQISSQKLIYFSKGGLHIIDTQEFNQILFVQGLNSCPIYLEENNLIVRKKENSLQSLDILTGEETLLYESTYDNNSHLLYLKDNTIADIQQVFENWELTKEEGVILKLDGRTLFKWNQSANILHHNVNQVALALSKNEISFLSKSTGEILWISKITDAQSLKYQLETDIAIIFSSNKYLMSINKSDGSIMWEIEGKRLQCHYCSDMKELIIINNEKCTRTSTENGLTINEMEIPKSIEIEGHLTYYEDKSLYFIDLSQPAEIGSIDIISFKISKELSLEIKEQGTRSVLRKIIMVKDRLYVVDTLGNLKVFEKNPQEA